MTDELMAARAALHYWEEPCISGTEGVRSGILFRLYTSMCVLSRMPRLLQAMLERCCLWIVWQTFLELREKKLII